MKINLVVVILSVLLWGAQACVVTSSCGGECIDGIYSVCTCAPDDPCGWQFNGICDSPCLSLGVNPFDDGADCSAVPDPCAGECSSGLYTSCTCAPDDPCGYIGDGTCDDACYAIGINPLDDTADCGVPAPCGGECAAGVYTACTCAPDDPCGYIGDGTCDDACYAIGSNPLDDTADCGPGIVDTDGDGIDDSEEVWFASTFEPALAFAFDEVASERYPVWAVEPTTLGVSIFYALSYYEDGGEDTAGTNGTYGDPEFIVVDVVETVDGWDIDAVYLSAYYRVPLLDVSQWYPAEAFAYDTSDGGIHPVVYVASQDHAMFPTLADCDAGAWVSGLCDDEGSFEFTGVQSDGNLGNPIVPLIDELLLAFDGVDYTEFYFTVAPFCGWWVPDGAPRVGCAADDYGSLIGDWLNGL